MTRVAFFDGYPHMYVGAQRSMHQVAASLQRRDWDVEILLPADGAFAQRLARDGLPHRVIAAPSPLHHYGHTTTGWRVALAAAALPRYWWRLRRALRGHDLVHINDQRGIVLAGPAARMAGVPVVWHVHGVRPPRIVNVIGRVLASRTIALTEADARELAAPRFRHAPDVVANTPDEAFFAIERRPVDPPVLVAATRLSPVKGVDILLRAVAVLHERRPDVTALVLGGEQPGYIDHVGELERLRAALGLEHAVTFAGHVDDTRAALSEASVYVQPARWEGVPLAVLEAMAAGLPVVATDVGGLRDVIDPGVTGLLVPPEDPRALADGVNRLLDDPALAQRLGEAGRAFARERQAGDAGLDRLLEIYAAVLS